MIFKTRVLVLQKQHQGSRKSGSGLWADMLLSYSESEIFPQSPKIGKKKKKRGEKLQPFPIIWLSSQRATGKAVIKRLA